MKKIEYLTETYHTPKTGPAAFTRWLDRYGKDGWELCFTQDLIRSRVCVFRREAEVEKNVEALTPYSWECRGCGKRVSAKLETCPSCGVGK